MSITPTSGRIIPRLRRDTILSLLEKDTRLDGRKLNEYREIVVAPGVIPKSEGSALARIGSTTAIAGVKIGVGTPFPDTPNEGVLTVNVEFVPLASPTLEPGPPDENAIEIARVIDRCLREIRAIDLSKLVIIPGEKVYIIWLDIYILDHDGNVLDASMLAGMAALLDTRVPKVEIDEKKNVRIIRDETTPLPINHKVVTVSIAKIGNKLIVDPNLDEDDIVDAKITIGISDDGRIVGLQKAGPGVFTYDDLRLAIKYAKENSVKLLRALEEKKGTKISLNSVLKSYVEEKILKHQII
ncbi:MAG TPA: exosome complex protein Rrp42 [Desulfurococcales archaeon]|nr:exosome complex protein Rrp42 [Desulfurococcales archaeon]